MVSMDPARLGITAIHALSLALSTCGLVQTRCEDPERQGRVAGGTNPSRWREQYRSGIT